MNPVMPNTPDMMDIIVGLHVVFSDYREMSEWLNKPNKNLNNQTPLNHIAEQGTDDVLDLVDRMCSDREID